MRTLLLLGFVGISGVGCGDAGGSTPVLGDAAAPGDSGMVMDPDAGTVPIADADAAVHVDAAGGDEVRFETVFGLIFYPRCGGCHNATEDGRAPDVASYEALVGAASAQVPGMVLVAPGEPEASYLLDKIAGTHADTCRAAGIAVSECGLRMPRGIGAEPLREDQIATVRAWIEGGAMP